MSSSRAKGLNSLDFYTRGDYLKSTVYGTKSVTSGNLGGIRTTPGNMQEGRQFTAKTRNKLS